MERKNSSLRKIVDGVVLEKYPDRKPKIVWLGENGELPADPHAGKNTVWYMDESGQVIEVKYKEVAEDPDGYLYWIECDTTLLYAIREPLTVEGEIREEEKGKERYNQRRKDWGKPLEKDPFAYKNNFEKAGPEARKVRDTGLAAMQAFIKANQIEQESPDCVPTHD